jgi:hypothetical protein
MKLIDAGDPSFRGEFLIRDKALPSMSPSANPVGIWESIAQRRKNCCYAGSFFLSPACLLKRK